MKIPPAIIHLKDRALVQAKRVPWWGWALGGVGGLMLFGRSRDMIGGAWDTTKNAALSEIFVGLGLTDEMINAILAASEIHGVSPLIIYAIGYNETRWGSARSYVQDTGDWTGRAVGTSSHWENVPGTKVVAVLPAGWAGTGAGPWVIPEDELGWGRGIMQLDYANARGLDYHDIRQMVEAGTKHFAADFDAISKVVAGYPGWDPNEIAYAAIAAYNRGLGGVLKNIANGADAGTGSVPDGKYAQLAWDQMSSILSQL